MDHRYPLFKDSGVMEEDEYEDSSLFLSMIDAAAEKILEACSERNAAESSAIAIAWDTEVFPQGASNPLQDIPPAPQASSSAFKPRKRRKRSWSPDEPVQDYQPFPKINISWAASTPLKVFQAKESLTFANNSNICQHQRKRGSRNNNVIGSVGSSSVDDGFLAGAMLPLVAGNNGKCETQDIGKCDDLLKRIDRLESLILSYQKLMLSNVQTPTDQKGVSEHFRTRPCQCCNNVLDEKRISKQGLRKPERDLRLQTRLPSVGSSSFRGYKSHLKATKSFRDSVSEETSRGSRGSSSGSSTRESGYPYPSSLSRSRYSSVSAENEGEYQSSTERSSTDYETASYNSQDQYSDTSCSGLGQSSKEEEEEEDYHVENRKRIGMISKIGKKFGMIFHHHHHHHHHHHVGILKRVGKMFHRRGKSDDNQRQKPEKSRKPVTKSVTKKKQDGGHFRALADRFMRHRKHTKKTEKAKDEIGRVGSVGHKSIRGTKKVSWWPKVGRDKVKVANKGKVKKLGRAMTTRAKRSQFAAAKMILK